MGEHWPDRGVFRAKAPEGVAGRAEGVGGVDLVVGGDGIEEPQAMQPAAAVVEGEGGIEALGIEGDGRLGVHRGEHGLLERQIDRLALLLPVIAVIADRNDGVRWIELLHALGDAADEPALRRDRAGRAFLIMLVIGHQDEIVGELGGGAVIPLRIVERNGDREDQASGFQRIVHLAKKIA